MAKKINSNEKSVSYQIEKIRTPMSREKLNELYEEFKCDDDYINYHLDLIEDTHRRYMITILNDEEKSPIKNANENSGYYGYMKPSDALEFITNYIDEGKPNSKPKAVMQNGFSKRSIDKYKELVQKEEEEGTDINEFTKPTFDEIMNNIYVNTYNGSTYHESEDEMPDDLREDVGVIIPGLIESRDEYFEFVKKLKDRGRNGLGRSIYERYEDYENAVDIIEQYKQALFDKYGGKEEFFYAKNMGGIFGAYEYYPTVKPRFKKTARNIKMDKGINLNDLALIKDMGRRIREELDEEIEQCSVDHNYTIYENTPPKFKDLPDDLKLFYKTDKNNINGFTHTDKFTTLDQYAQKLISSKDPDKQIEGYRIVEEIKNELLRDVPIYESNFIETVDGEDLTINAMLSQYEYDKLIYETGDVDYVNAQIDTLEAENAYKDFLRNQISEINGYDMEIPNQKTVVNELADYATNYVFNEKFRRDIDERDKVNSAGDVLYRNNVVAEFGNESRSEKASIRNGDSRLKAYVREVADGAKRSLERLSSNADNVNKTKYKGESYVEVNEIVGDQTLDADLIGFELEPTPKEVLKYMKNNEMLAKKIYEISSDRKVDDMFSERTNIDDFVNEAKTVSKPMITQHMIDKSLQTNRRGE